MKKSASIFVILLLLAGIYVWAQDDDFGNDDENLRQKIVDLEAQLESIKGMIEQNANENLRLKETTEKLRQENEILRQKIGKNSEENEKLKGNNQKIEGMIRQNGDEDTKRQAATDTLKQQNDELKQELLDLEADLSKSPLVKSKVPITLYGYIKADLAYNTARANDVNTVRWIDSEATLKDDDDEFGITARQTRIGLNLESPEFDGIIVRGKIEVDFFRGAEENAPLLRMRHAYLEVEFKEMDLVLLAGQTWDLIFPLHAMTVNFTGLWSSGNMGFRRPQLRLTKNVRVGEKSKIVMAAAVTRTIGDLRQITGVPPTDTGEDVGYPSFQGSLAFFTPTLGDKQMQIFVCGHWGQEEYDTTATGDKHLFASWSIGGGFKLPIMEKVEITCELFAGKNLDAYFGGINQGVNLTTMEEISAMGGWVKLALGPFGPWQFNLGGGIDDPKDSDLNDGQRERNQALFANVFYNIGLIEGLLVACEVSYWNTQYRRQEDGDAIRVQSAFIYKF